MNMQNMHRKIGAATAGAAAVAVGAALALPGVASADTTDMTLDVTVQNGDNSIVNASTSDGDTTATVAVPDDPSIPSVGPGTICTTPVVYHGDLTDQVAQNLADEVLGAALSGTVPSNGDIAEALQQVDYPVVTQDGGDYSIAPQPGIVTGLSDTAIGIILDGLGIDENALPEGFINESSYQTDAFTLDNGDHTAATACVDGSQFYHDGKVSVKGEVDVTVYTNPVSDGSGDNGGNSGNDGDSGGYGIFTPSVDLLDALGNLF